MAASQALTLGDMISKWLLTTGFTLKELPFFLS